LELTCWVWKWSFGRAAIFGGANRLNDQPESSRQHIAMQNCISQIALLGAFLPEV
jgi:hypothetical protein